MHYMHCLQLFDTIRISIKKELWPTFAKHTHTHTHTGKTQYTHNTRTHFVCDTVDGWEGLEVLGPGQLRHEVLRLDGEPHLPRPRRQVQVQASLKTLLEKVFIGRNGAQIGKGTGHEIAPSFFWLG